MTKTYAVDGIEYTASNGRMRYNPQHHENHGKSYTEDDLIYICSMWDSMKKTDIAAALGKTLGSVMNKVYYLKKQGKFEYYKNLVKESITTSKMSKGERLKEIYKDLVKNSFVPGKFIAEKFNYHFSRAATDIATLRGCGIKIGTNREQGYFLEGEEVDIDEVIENLCNSITVNRVNATMALSGIDLVIQRDIKKQFIDKNITKVRRNKIIDFFATNYPSIQKSGRELISVAESAGLKVVRG